MADDLVSKLQAALLHHHVPLKPVPWRQHDSKDPTLAYISRMLLDDDQDEQPPQPVIHLCESYQTLMAELAALVSPPQDLAGTGATALTMTKSVHDDLTACLKAALVAAAEAVAGNRGKEVYRIVKEVRDRASLQGSSGERTALFFVDALLARFTGFGPQVYSAMSKQIGERHSVHVRLLNLPCLRVTQRFANCNILSHCQDLDPARRLHIIDYGIHYGCQWPEFIRLLSQRPQGAPAMKITGIELPGKVDVGETGRNLVEFAKSCSVSLEFESITSSSWELVRPRTIVDDFVVINCNLRLRHLREDGSVGDNPRNLFFRTIHSLRPDLFIQAVMDAPSNFASPFFLQRFRGSLDLFFSKMDMFEGLLGEDLPDEYDFMANLQAKSVMNVVACEGVERVERVNPYRSWDARAKRAGFEVRPLITYTVDRIKEVCCASTSNASFGNLKLGFDEGWLLLGWKDTVIQAMSTWKLKSRYI